MNSGPLLRNFKTGYKHLGKPPGSLHSNCDKPSIITSEESKRLLQLVQSRRDTTANRTYTYKTTAASGGIMWMNPQLMVTRCVGLVCVASSENVGLGRRNGFQLKLLRVKTAAHQSVDHQPNASSEVARWTPRMAQ